MLRLTGPLKFRSFWPRTARQWYPIPRTHTIWPHVTSSSSPSWSFGWRVEDSTPLKRFKRNRSGYLTQFQKGTSRDASKHGRNAGTAVFVQKGGTLKVMEEFNIQGKQTSFYKYCPGTFGYILVCPTITVLYHISGNFLTAPRIHALAQDNRVRNFTNNVYCNFCAADTPTPRPPKHSILALHLQAPETPNMHQSPITVSRVRLVGHTWLFFIPIMQKQQL